MVELVVMVENVWSRYTHRANPHGPPKSAPPYHSCRTLESMDSSHGVQIWGVISSDEIGAKVRATTTHRWSAELVSSIPLLIIMDDDSIDQYTSFIDPARAHNGAAYAL